MTRATVYAAIVARWHIAIVALVVASPLALLHCSKDEAAPLAPGADGGDDAPPTGTDDAAPRDDAAPLLDATADVEACKPPPALDPTCFATLGGVHCLESTPKCSSAPADDCPQSLTLDCTSSADCARFGNPDLAYCCMAGRPPETPPPANCSTPRIVPIAVPSTSSATFCATLGDCVNTPRGNYACKDNADCPSGTCQLHAIVGVSASIGLCR